MTPHIHSSWPISTLWMLLSIPSLGVLLLCFIHLEVCYSRAIANHLRKIPAGPLFTGLVSLGKSALVSLKSEGPRRPTPVEGDAALLAD